MGRAKRIWYLSHMRAAKVQASLRIRAVSPEPPLLANTSSESRGTFRQKPRSLAPLDDWACTVKICHDGMLEDTNSLDGAHVNQLILPSLQIATGQTNFPFKSCILYFRSSCINFHRISYISWQYLTQKIYHTIWASSQENLSGFPTS